LVVALLAVVASGAALWRTYDAKSTSHETTPKTTIRLGPALVTVPSLINKNGLIAAAQLAKLKLKLTVITGPSVTTNKNFVITQDPNPGTQVPEGTAVQLKLSSGPL
jgi:beta-lactam-binding protein with PASTA domain